MMTMMTMMISPMIPTPVPSASSGSASSMVHLLGRSGSPYPHRRPENPRCFLRWLRLGLGAQLAAFVRAAHVADPASVAHRGAAGSHGSAEDAKVVPPAPAAEAVELDGDVRVGWCLHTLKDRGRRQSQPCAACGVELSPSTAASASTTRASYTVPARSRSV